MKMSRHLKQKHRVMCCSFDGPRNKNRFAANDARRLDVSGDIYCFGSSSPSQSVSYLIWRNEQTEEMNYK